MKARRIIDYNGNEHIAYNCPGCGYEHVFSPKVHTFNNDLDSLTVSPSLLLNNPQGHHTCHSFVKEGKIQFLNDCWHALNGQTVDLPDYPIGTKEVEDLHQTDN